MPKRLMDHSLTKTISTINNQNQKQTQQSKTKSTKSKSTMPKSEKKQNL